MLNFTDNFLQTEETLEGKDDNTINGTHKLWIISKANNSNVTGMQGT